jgi:hypothetical protein
MTNPTSSTIGRRGIIHTVAIAAALSMGLGLSGCSILTGTFPGPESTPVTSGDSSPVFQIQDRPGYNDAEGLIVGMYDKYGDTESDGSALKLVPKTEAGIKYAGSFLYLLLDVRSAFRFLPGTESESATELDDQIQSYVDTATGYEEKFLAGEPLGVPVEITRGDGTVFSTDGTETPFD